MGGCVVFRKGAQRCSLFFRWARGGAGDIVLFFLRNEKGECLCVCVGCVSEGQPWDGWMDGLDHDVPEDRARGSFLRV